MISDKSFINDVLINWPVGVPGFCLSFLCPVDKSPRPAFWFQQYPTLYKLPGGSGGSTLCQEACVLSPPNGPSSLLQFTRVSTPHHACTGVMPKLGLQGNTEKYSPKGAPGWLSQFSVWLHSAQVMISWSVGSCPTSGSVRTVQSLEPALDSMSPSLSDPPLLMLSLSLPIKNK